ncbi:MAG: DUF2182 domain-containing protein, partial [Burkholderiales bacterium]|nr:DUF2182 domain-containing protein [Burkholderiales bacterium]
TFLGIGMEMTAFEMTPNPFASSQPTEAMQMHPPQWTPSYALIMFTMWWFMMVAMMLPSAAPTVLLAAAINRRSEPDKPPFGPTSLFVTGYLLAWFIFSSFAVAAQWLL